MKTGISAGLLAHKAAGVATLATCWLVTRRDTTRYGFTTHVRDITDVPAPYNGITFQARSAFTPSEVGTRADLSVDNLEVAGILSSLTITENDLLAGRWDFATVEVFEINYNDRTHGVEKKRFGTLGNVSRRGAGFRAELRGLNQYLQHPIGEVFQTTCRATLGDARCGVALSTIPGTVVTPNGQIGFTNAGHVEPAGWYDNGLATWTSGPNNGLQAHIRAHTAGGVFTFAQPMPFAIGVGDAYSLTVGCRKRAIEDCKTKFNNIANFRGEPYVVGMDKLIQIGRRG